jgi:hypothetical protein
VFSLVEGLLRSPGQTFVVLGVGMGLGVFHNMDGLEEGLREDRGASRRFSFIDGIVLCVIFVI